MLNSNRGLRAYRILFRSSIYPSLTSKSQVLLYIVEWGENSDSGANSSTRR